MTGPLGVGVIGAGPVTQAIHIPALATLPERLKVRHIMDVDQSVATDVAGRVAARASTDVQSVLDDVAVDIVAICSPPQFHADQVAAACQAGKKAILCEKPLATSAEEAHRIARASRTSGVPIIVGTMHAYDPAYVAASGEWGRLSETARLVRSVIYLPPNDEMVALATDLVAAPAPPRPAASDASGRAAQAARMRTAILGLAIHNTPLVRQLLASEVEVKAARALTPFGYMLALASGECSAQMLGFMPGGWQPEWTLQAWGEEAELRVGFPPSYVLAGSATAELSTAGARSVWHYPENGYQAEWRHAADVAERIAEPSITLQDIVDDLLFALDIADGAARLILDQA
jgi:predicted dehydrogenase